MIQNWYLLSSLETTSISRLSSRIVYFPSGSWLPLLRSKLHLLIAEDSSRIKLRRELVVGIPLPLNAEERNTRPPPSRPPSLPCCKTFPEQAAYFKTTDQAPQFRAPNSLKNQPRKEMANADPALRGPNTMPPSFETYRRGNVPRPTGLPSTPENPVSNINRIPPAPPFANRAYSIKVAVRGLVPRLR